MIAHHLNMYQRSSEVEVIIKFDKDVGFQHWITLFQ